MDKIDYSTLFKEVNELSQAITLLRHNPGKPMIFGVCIETSIHALTFMIAALEHNAFYYIDPKSSCPMKTLNAVKPEYVVVEYNPINLNFSKWIQCYHIKTKFEVFGKVFAIFDLYSESFQIENSNENLAYVVRTSGTSGFPKLVFVPWSCIGTNVYFFKSKFGVTSEAAPVFFSAAPFSFDPSVVNFLLCLVQGCLLVIASTDALLKKSLSTALLKVEASIIQCTPSLLSAWDSVLPLSQSLFCSQTSVKTLLIGGEVAPPSSLIKTWLSNCLSKVDVFSLYGISEVSCWASLKRLNLDSASSLIDPKYAEFSHLLTEERFLGEVLDDTLLVVVENNSIIKEGIGEIFLGRTIGDCEVYEYIAEQGSYRNSSALSPDGAIKSFSGKDFDSEIMLGEGAFHKFKSGLVLHNTSLFPTGDRAYVSSELKEVVYIGRLNRIVKHLGERVDVGLVESCLGKITGVKFCHAIFHQNKIIVFLQFSQDSGQIYLEIKNSMQSQRLLSRIPMVFHETTQIWPNAHGKIDNEKLLASYEQSHQFQEESRSTTLANIWKSILLCEPTHDDNFVSCGGNSIKAVLFVECLKESLGQAFDNLIDILLTGKYFEVANFVSSNQMSSSSKRSFSSISEHHQNLSFNDKKVKQNARSVAEIVLTRNVSLVKGVATTILEKRPPTGHDLKWSFDMKQCVDSSPLILQKSGEKQQLLFIASHSGLFVCLDAKSGEVIWSITLKNRIEASPCVASDGSRIMIGSYDGSFYCFKVNDGSILWSFETGDQIRCTAVYDASTGYVYFGSYDKYFYCLNCDGQLVWRVKHSGSSIPSSPCIVAGKVYVVCLQGILICYDSCNGEPKWRNQVTGPVFSPLSVFSKGLLVMSINFDLTALSLSGDVLWNLRTNDRCFVGLRVVVNNITRICTNIKRTNCACSFCSEEMIVFSDIAGNIYIVNENGNLLSSYQCPGGVGSTPYIVQVHGLDSYFCCVVAQKNGTILFLDFSADFSVTSANKPVSLKCQTRFTFVNEGEVFSSPIFYDSKLYVGGRNNFISCYSC